jgi:hypothetical protein
MALDAGKDKNHISTNTSRYSLLLYRKKKDTASFSIIFGKEERFPPEIPFQVTFGTSKSGFGAKRLFVGEKSCYNTAMKTG